MSKKRAEREWGDDTGGSESEAKQVVTWTVGSERAPSPKRWHRPPGQAAVKKTYSTLEEGMEALNAECAPYGVSFHVRGKNKPTAAGTVKYYIACSSRRSSAKCKAGFRAQYDSAKKEFYFLREGCVLDHNDHMVLWFEPEGKLEEVTRTLKEKEDVAHVSAEDLRIAYTVPTSNEMDIPVRLGGQRQPEDEAQRNLARMGWMKYCTPQKILKTFLTHERDAFRGMLGQDDLAYFDWWLARREGMTTAFVEVSGVNALEMQLSILHFQRSHGVMTHGVARQHDTCGCDRYAIFNRSGASSLTALMAVDAHAFRAYRLVAAVTRLAVVTRQQALKNQMPITPLLMQSWVLTPADQREVSLTRIGMRTTLEFMRDHINEFRISPREAGMYDTEDPGFALYAWLPEYLALFSSTDRDIASHVVNSTALISKRDDTYYTWIMAFISQKELHLIQACLVDDLVHRFNPEFSSNADQLRQRYPHAFAILYNLYQMNGRMVHPLVAPSSWDKMGVSRPKEPLPPHYYIYELCFETELLDRAMRAAIATGITVPMEYKKVNPEESTAAKFGSVSTSGSRPHIAAYVTQQRAYQSRYAQTYALPSEEGRRIGLKPLHQKTCDLGAVRWLYLTLRAMDHHKYNGDLRHLYDDEFEGSNFGDVHGPLNVGDPVKFAMTPIDVPIAKSVVDFVKAIPMRARDQVVYFEKSVWACNVEELQLHDEKDRVLAEALVLVRDPRYYYEYHRGEGSATAVSAE